MPIWKYVLPTKKLLKSIEILDEFVYKIIDKAIARQGERERQRSDDDAKEDEGHATLLDHFLSHQKENNFVDREYLRSMLLNFLLAGRDTVIWPSTLRLHSFALCPTWAGAYLQLYNWHTIDGIAAHVDNVVSFATPGRGCKA